MSCNDINLCSTAEETLSFQLEDAERRRAFFDSSEEVASVVSAATNLQRLYDEAVSLFEIDGASALKLMFHIYFEGPSGEAMYHVFDSIGLYMQNEMTPEVCQYIQRYWLDHSTSLSDDDKAWWKRECASWNCELA